MGSIDPNWQRVIDQGTIMENEGFSNNLPKEIKGHLKSIWIRMQLDPPWCKRDGGYEDWDVMDTGEIWQPGYLMWNEDHHPLVLCLWKLYNYWKMTGGNTPENNTLWHKEKGYLLGEIMWLLILNKKLDLSIYYYDLPTFNEIIPNLKNLRWHGHPSIKKLQEEHGDIIYDHGGSVISLSDEWNSLLDAAIKKP